MKVYLHTYLLKPWLLFILLTVSVLSKAASEGSATTPETVTPQTRACEFCNAITSVPAGVSLEEIQEDCLKFFSMYPEALDVFDSVYVVPPQDPVIVDRLSTTLSGAVTGISGPIPEPLVTAETLVIFPSALDSVSFGNPVSVRSFDRGYYRNTQHGRLKTKPKSSFSLTSTNQANALFSIEEDIRNLYIHGLELVNQNDDGSTISQNVEALIQTTSTHQVENFIFDEVVIGNNTVERRENFSLNRMNVTGRISMNNVTMNCDSLASGQRCFFLECTRNCGSSFFTLSQAAFTMGVLDTDGRDVFGLSLSGLNNYRIYNVSLIVSSVPDAPFINRLFGALNLPASQPDTVRCASDITIIEPRGTGRAFVGISTQDIGDCFDSSLLSATPFFCPVTASVTAVSMESTSIAAVTSSIRSAVPTVESTTLPSSTIASGSTAMVTATPLPETTTASTTVTSGESPSIIATTVATTQADTTGVVTTESDTTTAIVTTETPTEEVTTPDLTTAQTTEVLETTTMRMTTESPTEGATTPEVTTQEQTTADSTTPAITTPKPTTTDSDLDGSGGILNSTSLAFLESTDSVLPPVTTSNMIVNNRTSDPVPSVTVQTAGLSSSESIVSQLIPVSSESVPLDLSTTARVLPTSRLPPTSISTEMTEMPTDGSGGRVAYAWAALGVGLFVGVTAVVAIGCYIYCKHRSSHSGEYDVEHVQLRELEAPIMNLAPKN